MASRMEHADLIMSPSRGPSPASIDHRLLRDPAGGYMVLDEHTQARYRAAVASLAARSGLSEAIVADRAIDRATAAAHDPAATPAAKHVGYYLMGPGAASFEDELSVTRTFAGRCHRYITFHPRVVHWVLVAVVAMTYVGATGAYAMSGGSSWATLLALVVILVPIAVQLSYYAIPRVMLHVFPSRILPKLAFADGIPDSCLTLVAIPTVLTDPADATRSLQRLETVAAANPDTNIRFALLADFPDSPTSTQPIDAAILAAAAKAAETANNRCRDHLGDKFFVLHRFRQWNPAEGRWMGWERKRGKILSLNELVRAPAEVSAFEWIAGDLKGLLRHHRFRYVLVLDEDTDPAPGLVVNLVRTAEHPLNRPVYDRAAGRVVEGYGVLQPTVVRKPVETLGPAVQTLYAKVMSGYYPGRWLRRVYGDVESRNASAAKSAAEPAKAVRLPDYLFNAFGETDYAGKGLYDIDTFRAGLHGALPENRILSHDNLEGYHLRAGIVGDAVVAEPGPSRYASHTVQYQRWLRGDCQTVPWILSAVRTADGRWRRNPVGVVWRAHILIKILMRLAIPAQLVLLLLAGAVLPGSPIIWLLAAVPVETCWVLAAVKGALGTAWPPRRVGMFGWRRAVAGGLVLGYYCLMGGFVVLILADRAYCTINAVGLTTYRMLVSRRGLLQWEVQREMNTRMWGGPASYVRRMWFCMAWAIANAGVVAMVAPTRLGFAIALGTLWSGAPLLAWRLDVSPVAGSPRRLIEAVSLGIDQALAPEVQPGDGIVVSGFWRSGTTWLQQAIARMVPAKAVTEPLCPSAVPAVLSTFPVDLVLREGSYDHYLPFARRDFTGNPALGSYLEAALRGRTAAPAVRTARQSFRETFRQRVVLKEVRAQLCLGAIQGAFGVPVIHIHRDPRAIVASLLRNRWSWWLEGLSLEEQLLAPRDGRAEYFGQWRGVILAHDRKGFIERATAYWALTETYVSDITEHMDGRVEFVSYEKLVTGGREELRSLLERLGIVTAQQVNERDDRPSPTASPTRRNIAPVTRIRGWRDELDSESVSRIEAVVREFGLAERLVAGDD